MAQQEIELILMRQLATCLTVPMVIIDEKGDLLFYNEPAEAIYGFPFDLIPLANIKAEEWSRIIKPTSLSGEPITPEDHPVMVALRTKRPLYDRYRMHGVQDGKPHDVEGVSFPLHGQSGRLLGAVGIFWEMSQR